MGLFSFITDDILGMGGGYDDAQGRYDEAYQLFDELAPPNPDDIMASREDYTYSGDFTPEQLTAYRQDATELSNVSTDPRLKTAQMNALERLSSLASEGGLSAIDKARMADIESQTGRAARGAREALEQNAQARGTAGSGLSMVNQMVANQEAANRASSAGQDAAARAEMRALEALMKSGEMGGQIRDQDYREQYNRAAAQDSINRFNTSNRQGVAEYNTGNRNQAAYRNLEERNRMGNLNREERNRMRVDLPQRNFENEVVRRRGMTGFLGDQANADIDRSRDRDRFMGGLIGAGASMFGGG